MNSTTKRRLPSSLRKLLTDISPKEEWTDMEPDLEGDKTIILPSREAIAGPVELLTPAIDQTAENSQENGKRRAVCMLCNSKPSPYTCPRCNVPYCSLACYKSPEHSICSEDFYKESVLQEIQQMGKSEAEGKKKMQEILIGLRKKAENTDGGMESLLKENDFLSEESEQRLEDTKINVKAIELLSRLAELQEADEENAEEIETILRSLQKIEAGDSDGEPEEESDLAERLQGLDIDELSEEQLWSLLNKKDKEKFEGLIKHGALGGLVPLWKPWWEEHEKSVRLQIEVLQETINIQNKGNVNTEENLPEETQGNKSSTEVKTVKKKRKDTNNIQDSGQTGVPPVSAKIPKLSSLCSNPSPLVGFSLINVLFAYSFSLCFFNGDTDSLIYELCDMILALSEVLNSNKVFNSIHEALDSNEKCILSEGYLDRNDSNAFARAVEAVVHILTGRNRTDSLGYCLSALSHLRSVLSQARASLSKEGEDGKKRQKYFMASKKCEFLQAWVIENSHNVNIFSIELWNEHCKKESEKFSMTKAKSMVEQNWKKGGRRGNCKLVEEL